MNRDCNSYDTKIELKERQFLLYPTTNKQIGPKTYQYKHNI